jgi:hypothetical protein
MHKKANVGLEKCDSLNTPEKSSFFLKRWELKAKWVTPTSDTQWVSVRDLGSDKTELQTHRPVLITI